MPFNLSTGYSINLMLSTQTIKPMVSEPESPIKILAGLKLKTKKPNKEPPKANAKDAKIMSLAQTNQVPNAIQAIKPTPPAKPSTPSIKLNALTTTVYVNKERNTLAQYGISFTSKIPCKPVIRILPTSTKIKPANTCAINFFMGAVPIMSSFIPTKNNISIVATISLNSRMY